MRNESDLPTWGYMRLPATLEVYPVGRSTWWAGVKSGKFPKPVKLGVKTTAWRVEDIRALLENPTGLKPRSFVERIQAKPPTGGNAAARSLQEGMGR